MKRMQFFSLGGVAIALLWTAVSLCYSADTEHADIKAEITKRHDEAVKRLQDWIEPGRRSRPRTCGYPRRARSTWRSSRKRRGLSAARPWCKTDGQPGIFATLDAGAPRTVGIYFMYDVKQVDPSEWSSPPFEAAIVDKPDLGKVIVGRGAVNQKGPEASFLAALHAIRGAGRKLPVNLVFVAEGEEEIGSPHFPQIVRRPEVLAALRKCAGVYIPSAEQDRDGKVTMTLGAKGIVELELVRAAKNGDAAREKMSTPA